jgi:hypothetical protein
MPVINMQITSCDQYLEVTTKFLGAQINNYLNCKISKTHFNKNETYFTIMSLVFIENKNCWKHYIFYASTLSWHVVYYSGVNFVTVIKYFL